MRRQSVAVIGTGCRGSDFVRTFDRLGVLYGVCDNEPGGLEALPLNDAALTTPDPDVLLGNPAVDAVVIATPAPDHYAMCWDALDAGKDVLIEQPLALKVSEAEELVRLSEARGRVLMVGHVLRYDPAVLRLQELIASGELGSVEYIHSSRLGAARLRGEESILSSFAPQDISVAIALLGSPLRVAAHGEAFPERGASSFTLTDLVFSGGVKARVEVSWLHPIEERRLTAVASNAIAVLEDVGQSDRLVLYRRREARRAGPAEVAAKGERVPVMLPADDPLENECRHFLECCVTRISPRTDGHEGLSVLRVLAAAESSLRSGGKPITIPPSSNGRRRPLLTGSARRPDEQGDARACADRPSPLQLSPFYVHPTAIVEPGSSIGAGTKTWHWTRISAGARIGRNCVFGQGVFVDAGVVIGDNCRVQDNVSLYRGVAFEDDVFCGPSSVFSTDSGPRAFIDREAGVLRTLVKQGASIGANATVGCGIVLGRYCLIGSGAVVTRDVPDFALMIGVPARQQGWVCRCGTRLAFNGNRTACDKCGSEYELSDNAVFELKPDRRDIPEAVRSLLEDTALADD